MLGLGAAAAPTVTPAQVLAESPLIGPAMNGALSPEFETPLPAFGKMSPKGKWKRILKIKSILSGQEEEEEEPYSKRQRYGLYEEGRLNSLRSVSYSHKYRMLHRRMRDLAEDEKKSYLIRELFGLENPDED